MRAQDFRDEREPPLRLGDRVMLNSGGPICLVVDEDGEAITVAWPEGETRLPRACFHRARD